METPNNKGNQPQRIAERIVLLREYLAECIGTCVLVVLGCGTAMLVGAALAALAYQALEKQKN